MGSYPVTQGQGERKRVQEKMQALCVCKKLLCRSVYAQASLSGPRTLGRGFSALELQVARASSLDSEHTEAQRGTVASPVSRSHPPERHLTPRSPGCSLCCQHGGRCLRTGCLGLSHSPMFLQNFTFSLALSVLKTFKAGFKGVFHT